MQRSRNCAHASPCSHCRPRRACHLAVAEVLCLLHMRGLCSLPAGVTRQRGGRVQLVHECPVATRPNQSCLQHLTYLQTLLPDNAKVKKLHSCCAA